jgi:hypothetical protein
MSDELLEANLVIRDYLQSDCYDFNSFIGFLEHHLRDHLDAEKTFLTEP